MSKPTKQGSLTQQFLQAAQRDPEGALSHMLLAAFGITLGMLMGVADRVVATKDVQMAIMALTAGVQIRNHVTFVGREYANVRTKYPEVVIEGPRPQTDIFNYGALHALGHILSHMSGHSLGDRIIAKAGSCITGEKLTESEAGTINKEIFASWTQDDREAWRAWKDANLARYSEVLRPITASVSARSTAFAGKLAAPAGRPVPVPVTGAGLLTTASSGSGAVAEEPLPGGPSDPATSSSSDAAGSRSSRKT